MKTLVRFLFTVLLTITLPVVIGCGSKEDFNQYMRAQVKITTQTSENSFGFDERCYLFSDVIDGETYWEIDATDMKVPFGIYIGWKESFISGPGTYQIESGFQNRFAVIMRADPFQPGWYEYSEAQSGSVTFTHLGYRGGDTIKGTFDRVSLYDYDEDTLIEVNNGTFRCRVE